jgi:hypothetical protein
MAHIRALPFSANSFPLPSSFFPLSSLPSHISPLAADINLPPYAFIPPSNGSDSKWDYFKSKENATAEKSSVPPDFTAHPGLHIGAKVGIIVGAVIVMLGLALGVWLFRRNR